jgi:hypothetical protein
MTAAGMGKKEIAQALLAKGADSDISAALRKAGARE